MTNNNFEKRIQDKLNQFEVEPSENLLDNIFEKRAARSKGALNFSYLKLGVAMLSLAIITVAILYNRTSSGSGTQLSGDGSVMSSSDKGLTQPSDAQTAENKSNSTSIAQGGNVNPTADKEKESGVERSNKSTMRNVAPTRTVKNRHLAELVSSKDRKKNESDLKKEKIANNHKVVSITKTNNGNTPFKGTYNDNGNNIAERYFNVDAKDRPMIASIYNKGNSHLMVYHSVDKERLDNVDLNYMLLKPMRAIPYGKTESEQIAMINYKALDRKVGVNNHKPLFIDVMFSPVLSFHNVAGNGVDGHYQTISKSNFNKQYNLRLSYPVSHNLNVFAGVGYMNLVTSFKGDYNYSEAAVNMQITTRYINDPVLGTIKVVDTVNVNYIKNSTQKCDFKNTYNIVSVPLGLSYNFGIRKFDFGIHGSALLNIYTHANGSNADFVKHQTTAFSSEKKHLGLGGGISFMVAYQLNNKFKLVVEPGLQYFRINGGKIGNSVNEKVLNNGLNIGLRYTLY